MLDKEERRVVQHRNWIDGAQASGVMVVKTVLMVQDVQLAAAIESAPVNNNAFLNPPPLLPP